MGHRPGPIEQMTQAPGEERDIPTQYIGATVAQIRKAEQLLDECNGDSTAATEIVIAVAQMRSVRR